MGGKHFIVNTSHNGNGPLYRGDHTIWCNPPNAAAGELPTTNTGHPKADAYLWVERPGYLERRVQRRPGASRGLVGEARDPDGRAREVVAPRALM